MDMISVELLTLIATDNFNIFITLLQVPTIGQRLCEWYPQMTARGKFITYKNNSGCKKSYLNNRLHSFNNQPAVEYATSGDKKWYWNGKLHRRDLPAVECVNGDKCWYWNGERHRENDLPAIEYATSGSKCWYWHGKRHRRNLPAIERANGIKEWYWNGKRHRRNDLHAIECANGRKEWFIHDKFIK
jgi:hypothetical protein